MKLNRTFAFYGAIATAASIALGSNIHANDLKTIPGAACQAMNGSQEGDINKTAEGAVNISNGNRMVTCLNVRDNVTNTNGTVLAWIYVVQRADQNTRCFNRVANPNGSVVITIPGVKSGEWIRFGPSTRSAQFGTYLIYCELPPAARISTILLEEFPDTNAN